MRNRRVKSIKDELLKKARESMLAAVQIYNNPHITFKAETFITLSIIAWTYLMHSYYRGLKIDYKYFDINGKRKKYHKTKNVAFKHWELERCINYNNCPLDSGTKNNLRFLIGIRHEIEHQMTNRIDEFISAKLQACAMNFDYYLRQFFGDKHSISQELSLNIQLASVTPEQKEQLIDNDRLNNNIRNFIASFEDDLSDKELRDSQYAYRLLFVPLNAKRKNHADKVIEFVKPDSQQQPAIERVLYKETEKPKYLPSEIILKMKHEGFVKMNMTMHTNLWKSMDAKNPSKHFGTMVAKTWYWYESWVTEVREYCIKNKEKFI